MLRVGAAWIAGWLSASACSPPPPPHATPSPARSVASAGRPDTSATIPEQPVPLPPRPQPDSCATDVEAHGPPLVRLAKLWESCGAGMTPLADPVQLELQPNQAQSVPFSIEDAARCIRVAAASDMGDLELAVLDASDSVLAEDSLPGALALIEPDGPLCLAAPGNYRAVIPPSQLMGPAALQIWQANE